MNTMDLKELRVSIVGNKDLKYKLSNDNLFIPQLAQSILSALKGGEISSMMDQLIILKFLIQFNEDCVFQFEEILSEFNYELCKFLGSMLNLEVLNLKLINLLLEVICAMRLTPEGTDLYKFVVTMLTIQYETVSDDFYPIISKSVDLIPVVAQAFAGLCNDANSGHSKTTNLQFTILYEKVISKLAYELNQYYETGNSDVTIVYKLLLSLNHMLSKRIVDENNLTLSSDLITKLNFVFRLDNGLLNLNIIKLFNLLNVENNNIYKLVELIDNQNYKTNSFSIISELVKKSDKLVNDLVKFKIDIKLIDYLSQYFPSNEKFKINYMNEMNMSDLLLLLSLLTHNNEELRNKFVEGYNFKSLINSLLGFYKLKLLTVAKKVSAGEDLTNEIDILNSDIFLNLFKLIRSFSRSIKLLRIFFINLNLTNILVDILELQCVLQVNNDIKLINLSIFANLILDFSSFRSNLASNERFLKVLSKAYRQPLENQIYKEQVKLIYLQFVKNLMYNEKELNKMILMKELITIEEIVEYLSYMEPFKPENEIHNLKLEQKLSTFDILRNLSSNSNYFNLNLYTTIEQRTKMSWNQIILRNIINLSSFNEIVYFNYSNLLQMIYNTSYNELLLSSNYIENHKILTIKNIKIDENIVNFWKVILDIEINEINQIAAGLDIDTFKFSNNIHSLKLSIIWILLNITWSDNLIKFYLIKPQRLVITKQCNFNIEKTMGTIGDYYKTNAYEEIDLGDSVNRCQWLVDLGICKSLNNIIKSIDIRSEILSNDIKEKSQAVVDQINGILNEGTPVLTGEITYDKDTGMDEKVEDDMNNDSDIDSYWVN